MCGVLIDLGVVRSISQYAAIERLPDEVLTEIFIFDRLISISLPKWSLRPPWNWHRLVHVCRRWRHIIFDSPRSLNLQLFCTYGTPVKNNLDCWPALPIVMQYRRTRGFWDRYLYLIPNSEIPDEDNIMAALPNSDRICKLRLDVTAPLLGKLTTQLQKPFPALEHLELGADTDYGLILPNESFVGPFPKLRVLHVARVGFPALQRVLPLAQGLVELHLAALPSSGYYVTAAALLAFLPIMTRLKDLYLEFLSPISRPISGRDGPAPQGRAVLIALERFTFWGISEDLECLLSGIDAPDIISIDIMLFNQATIFDTSHFLKFISRTQTQRSHDTAMLCCSESDVSMTLLQQEKPLRMTLKVRCMPLDWQLSCMAEIFADLYPIVRDVRSFYIIAIPSNSVQDDVDPSPLLELFRLFTNVEKLFLPQHIASHVTYILEREGLLPNARVTTAEPWPPRERTLPLHLAPWLAHIPTSSGMLHVVWDVSEPPSKAKRISGKGVFVDMNDAFSSNVPAVFPETDEIVVVYNTGPGLAQDLIEPIMIKKRKVSCGDVFWAIYEYFQKPMSPDEVGIIKSRSEDDYRRLLESCYRRCLRTPDLADIIRRQGVKRVDCLDDRTAWWGLRPVWAADGTWSLHLDLILSSSGA
jgi:F-box-like